MFELNLNTPAKLAPAPAAVDPVLPYRILVDLISLARREEMGWPNDESIEMLLGVVGAIAAAVGDGAHRERRDCVVARAVRFYIVTRRIIVDHLAAELITLFPHEESSLKSEILMLGINLLVESNEVRRITGLDSKEHYDKSLIPHEHFICQKCGKIEDVFDMDIISYLKKNTNKRINSYELIVKGYCSLCNERV